MRVLLVHNGYREPGGEDTVFASEAALLREAGHEVDLYHRSNREIDDMGALRRLGVARRMIWSNDVIRDVRTLIRRRRPDVAHVHNTFFVVSPAVYSACRSEGVPVVQSLHNPRLLCPAASFHREERLCQECLGRTLPWPAVRHGCYRGSRLQSAMVAGMLTTHRLLGTWQRLVDRFVVFTEFYRHKFVEGGLPAEKIVVKPHFVDPDPGAGDGRGDYCLFVGRLDPPKGVRTLLRAWRELGGIPLRIRGDGELSGEVDAAIGANGGSISRVERLSRGKLAALFQRARVLVCPSEGFYETFGLVLIEAFACGIPVIASGTGVTAEIVEDGRTGLHFDPGVASDLAAKVRWAWDNPEAMRRMGANARAEFLAKYTASANRERLEHIYEGAIRGANRRP